MHIMYLMLEKVLWVIKEKSEASAILSWSHPACQPHLFPAFTAIVFTALATLGAHFLDFITDQSLRQNR